MRAKRSVSVHFTQENALDSNHASSHADAPYLSPRAAAFPQSSLRLAGVEQEREFLERDALHTSELSLGGCLRLVPRPARPRPAPGTPHAGRH